MSVPSLAEKEGRRPKLEHQTSAHIPADWHLADAAAAGAEEGAGAGAGGDDGLAAPTLYSVTSMDPLFPHVSLEDLEAEVGGRRSEVGGSGGDSPYGCRERGGGGAGAREAAEPEPAGGPTWRDEAAPYLRVALWLALLWAGYGFQRGLCAAGLPYDCETRDHHWDDVFTTMTLLAFLGGPLAWLAGVAAPARFAWLFAWRRAYLWLAYAAVFPAYSAIASLPAMRVSLANTTEWGPAPIILKAVVGAVLAAAVALHVWLAVRSASDPSLAGASDASASGQRVCSVRFAPGAPAVAPDSPARSSTSSAGSVDSKLSASWAASLKGMGVLPAVEAAPPAPPQRPSPRASPRAGGSRRRRAAPRGARRRALALYLSPRLALLLWFGAWWVLLPATGQYSLHLHHYALGWAVASFASFNHPVSGAALALGTAIFVQGGAAYGFDPILTWTGPVEGLGCLDVQSNATGQMTCAFWADRPFNISFCSNTSWVPWFDCSVEWPWPETKVRGNATRRGTKRLADGVSGGPPFGRLAAAVAPYSG